MGSNCFNTSNPGKLDLEYLQRIMNNQKTYKVIHQNEYEQAANSYLMTVVGVIAGLPLPIINLIASFCYYLAKRKSSYFVRWHSIQAILAQLILIPFNSIAWAWTLGIILKSSGLIAEYGNDDRHHIWPLLEGITVPYLFYMLSIVLFNIFEFFAVIYTSIKVKKGENVRWFLIAGITDRLCSKEKRDIYNI